MTPVRHVRNGATSQRRRRVSIWQRVCGRGLAGGATREEDREEPTEASEAKEEQGDKSATLGRVEGERLACRLYGGFDALELSFLTLVFGGVTLNKRCLFLSSYRWSERPCNRPRLVWPF